MTLAETLHEGHTRWCERAAIKCQGRLTTYGGLCSTVAVLDAYDRHVIQTDDRLTRALVNRPEYVIVMMAAWMRGAVHVGVDGGLSRVSEVDFADLRQKSS